MSVLYKTFMLRPDLIENFVDAAGASHATPAPRADRVLNYVWINKQSLNLAGPQREEETGVQCGIPLNYFDKAYGNARLYPDTEVHVWVDDLLLDGQSRFFLQSHAYLNAPENVTFRDLREIPAYAAHPSFAENSATNIWNRVDLARFMVLSHQLENPERDQVFYADFDIDDADLDNPKTKERLDDMGMAFAELEKGEMLGHGVFNTVQHAYVAMNRSRKAFLDEKMLPGMSKAAERNHRVCSYIFRALYWEVYDLPRDVGRPEMSRIFTDVVVPPIKSKIPANPVYDGLKLCPSFSA